MKTYGNVFILGDSYSTFEGQNPIGYAVYYTRSADYTKVHAVKETWWHRLITATESRLVMNNSWSGSTVCYTGYGGYSPDQSMVKRIGLHLTDGMANGEKIDTLFILGATNDSWNDSPVGEVKYENWTDEDLCACIPAFCRILDHVRTTSPEVRIINIINGDCLRKEITDGMIEACGHYGAEYVVLSGIDLTEGHPTVRGMRQIADQVMEAVPPQER